MSLLMTGCFGTRFLEKDQKLLNRQSIRSPKGFSTEGLNDIYVQKANRKLFGVFNTLTYMYYRGLKSFNKETAWPFRSKNNFIRKKQAKEAKFDRKIAATPTSDQRRINNLRFRKQQKSDAINAKIVNGNLPMQWGEKISVYDTTTVRATQDKLNVYLFNHGYFEGKSEVVANEKKKRVNVVYLLKPGRPFLYDTLLYRVPDTAVHRLIRRYEPLSKLRVNDRYDQKNLSDERDRIDLSLKDHGYYDFSKQYIDFKIDTTYGHHHSIAVQTTVSEPVSNNSHRVFKIDSVYFTTDAGIKMPEGSRRQTKMYRDIRFSFFQDIYSRRILSNRVFLHRDSLYSRTNTFLTQRQLANLDIFKFVNINYDTSGGKFIANVFTSPLDRYSWTNEAGVTVTQGFPGPYYSLSLKKRNLFRGLEIFELNGRYGFEGVASATQIGNIYKSTEGNINGSITFPQFLFPFLRATSDRLGRFNTKTRLLAGYTYTDRPEYQRANVTVSATYTWQGRKGTQYSFTPINLQVIQSTTDSLFNAQLLALQAQGNNLINSFKPSLVSSMIFSMTWNPNNYGNTTKSSHLIRIQAESGGTLFNMYTPQYATERGLQTYQYLRLGFDIRRKQIIDQNTSVAFRFNSGVAYSYGANGALPYEKYFFAGGSNSVRAWRPRRLGFGSYPTILSTDRNSNGLFDYRYEKPGEILLEGSIEWRQKMFGFVSGALFIDAGNVWSFSQAPAPTPSPTTAPWADKGNTKFYFDKFLKEIAIGTGFGLRFDFTFLVLRLDVGIKAWDPGRAEGDRFVLNKFKFWGPYGTDREPVIYNVGIGYPF